MYFIGTKKNEFELATVNVSSVFETLKFYCTVVNGHFMEKRQKLEYTGSIEIRSTTS